MSRFDNVDVGPDMDRMVASFRRQVLDTIIPKMQEYIDDSSVESDNFLIGLDVTQAAAVELFNDFLLFLNDGTEPPVKVKTS